MDHRENKRAKGNHTFKCILLESKPRYLGATAARMSGGKIRRQESSDTVSAAMIGMIWTAMACDEHNQQQQLAGMRPVPRSCYDIKGRPDEHLWMEACDKEIKKLF